MNANEVEFEIECNDETYQVISIEQIEEGTVNDNPNHVLHVRYPNGTVGWVAGPHGQSVCCLSEWVEYIGAPAQTREGAIEKGCEG